MRVQEVGPSPCHQLSPPRRTQAAAAWMQAKEEFQKPLAAGRGAALLSKQRLPTGQVIS